VAAFERIYVVMSLVFKAKGKSKELRVKEEINMESLLESN